MQTKEEDEEAAAQSSKILEIKQGVKVLHKNMLGERFVRSSFQSVLLPESLEIIEDYAFYGCTSLQSIRIPNGVTRIGEYAFYGCEFQSLTLPQALTEIEKMSFYHCTSLKSINVPNGATKIGQFAFQGCKKLQSITLPQTLQEIGSMSFESCFSLQSISIPNGVTQIGEYAFYACVQLQSVTLPETLQEIKSRCFIECDSLQTIHVPNGVTRIGEAAFCDCAQLQFITLPQTLQEIEKMSFYRCRSLQSIIIPNSVTTIENLAFASCSALQIIALPNHTAIKDNSFAFCNMLDKTNQPNILIDWLKSRFDDLPLHQLCYHINSATTNKIASIQVNDQALIAQDAMGMTPLHILCSNQSSTPDVIKQLVSKYSHNIAEVRNLVGMTPLHMYLISKCVISHDDHQKVLSSNDFDYVSPTAIALLQDGVEYDIHEMVGMGLEYDVMDVLLAMNGRCIGEELCKRDEATGLYPFMSGATSHKCGLADIYKMAIGNISILQEEQHFYRKEEEKSVVSSPNHYTVPYTFMETIFRKMDCTS